MLSTVTVESHAGKWCVSLRFVGLLGPGSSSTQMAASNLAWVAVLCLSWLHHVGWHCAVPGVRSSEHGRHRERRPYFAFFPNTVRAINGALVFCSVF